DENPILTLRDYSKPSHEGYRNTIELPIGNNVLERLPAGSITTWEDLTTRFLAQFFPPGRTAKLRNDILMFQQHHGESLLETWTRPNPQPQALGTTFEVRAWDNMTTHTERMERFENSIFKQRKEINDRMTEMFGLLKKLITSRTPEKVLIREEAKFPITKNVNSISLAKGEEERSDKIDVATGNDIENPPEHKRGCKPKRRMKLENKK
ncbi:zinc finger, CCHC-type containing protein, partial [Tanacetum coccineum]